MKKIFWFKLLVVTFVLSSCQQELEVMTGLANQQNVKVECKENASSFTANVDEEKAKEVAEQFFGKNATTRSADAQVDYIEIIKNEQGTPLMYAVNFANEQGFVLVSATKKYYPILSYADKGHFDATTGGMNIWLEDEKEMLQACMNDTAQAFNLQWMRYEKREMPQRATTRVESPGPQDLHWWWMEFGNELCTPGYHSNYEDYHGALGELVSNWWCNVDEARNYLPDASSVYSEMAYKTESLGYTEQDVLYHFREFVVSPPVCGPLLETNWSQGFPYYWKVNKNLGCVTIAVAQIMNHHRKPAYYDWDLINEPKTEEQGVFFKELGESLGIDYSTDDSGAKIGDAERVLRNADYKVEHLKEYTDEQLNATLDNNNPVYMRGNTHQFLGFDSGDGHAWVCDGYDEAWITVIMTVYAPNVPAPSDGLFATNPYEGQGMRGERKSHPRFLHMNWGWGESNNSWNQAGDYTATNGKEYHRNTEFLFVEP